LAGTTRLELATSAVTGQRSNQLNYVPTYGSDCLADLATTEQGLKLTQHSGSRMAAVPAKNHVRPAISIITQTTGTSKNLLRRECLRVG
jgi:hypothetical protein